MKGKATDECFQMLISIFPKIEWSAVLVYYQTTLPGEATIRVTRSVFQGLMQMFVDKRALEKEVSVPSLLYYVYINDIINTVVRIVKILK